MNARTGGDSPFLEVASRPLRANGRLAGVICSLGERVQFFAARADLAALDGRVFDDEASLRAALARRLGARPAPGATAPPASVAPPPSEIVVSCPLALVPSDDASVGRGAPPERRAR